MTEFSGILEFQHLEFSDNLQTWILEILVKKHALHVFQNPSYEDTLYGPHGEERLVGSTLWSIQMDYSFT